MDILHKLRIIFWFLVIALWGIYLYQYINEDLNSIPKIKLTSNIFSKPAQQQKIQKIIISEEKPSEPKQFSKDSQPEISKSTEEINSNLEAKNVRMYVNTYDIKDIPPLKDSGEIKSEKYTTQTNEYPPPPEGFSMKISKHFVVYEEAKEVSQELINNLEVLHGNIMLDLIAFSPWQRDKKVFIYFCHSPITYQKLTGRPAWSGGAANSSERKIYLYESEEAFGILAHELSHIYFDSFFGENNSCPLWLSEGMAVFIQVERANAYPRWLKENLETLKNGGGYKLEDLVRIENLDGADDKSIKLWYAQSYSIVLFLLRVKSGDAFYQFCKNLKEGQHISKALFRAYGQPYNKLSNLEIVWRYDLKTGKLRQLNY